MRSRAVALDWQLRERRARGRSGWQTSGGVVLDPARGRLLLVRARREVREGRRGWTWPKGRIDPGEGPVFAALREISEEAGVLAEPLARVALMETRRALRHYYLLSLIRGGLGHGKEVLAVRWVKPDKALGLLDRKRDRIVLRAARRAIAQLGGARDLGPWQGCVSAA